MSINEFLYASPIPLIEEKSAAAAVALFNIFRKLVDFMAVLLIILGACSSFPSIVVAMFDDKKSSN